MKFRKRLERGLAMALALVLAAGLLSTQAMAVSERDFMDESGIPQSYNNSGTTYRLASCEMTNAGGRYFEGGEFFPGSVTYTYRSYPVGTDVVTVTYTLMTGYSGGGRVVYRRTGNNLPVPYEIYLTYAMPEPEPKYTISYWWWGLPSGTPAYLSNGRRVYQVGGDSYSGGIVGYVDSTYSEGTEAIAGDETYVFSGWTSTDVTIRESGQYSAYERDVLFTGEWKLKRYTVSYEWSGLPDTAEVSLPAEYVHTKNTMLSHPVDATYAEGTETTVDGRTYVFSGWTAPEITGDYVNIDKKDVVITGTWTLKTYTVSYEWSGLPGNAGVPLPEGFDYSGGDVGNVDSTYAEGTEVVVGNETYVFSGWTVPENPDGDVVITGTWTLKPGSDPILPVFPVLPEKETVPSSDLEIVLPPGWDMIPPPAQETESPLQHIAKAVVQPVKWIERITVPYYVASLYDVLVAGSKDSGGCLVDDECFAFTEPSSDPAGRTVIQVECVDFDLAELFAAEGVSLGVSVFEDEDFDLVDTTLGDRQVNYASLRFGDVVRTSTFNGIFVTSLTKGANYDEEKKTACSYISTVFQAFDRDHPEVFWLSGKCRVRIPTVRAADGTETAYFFLVLASDDGFTMRTPDWTKAGAVTEGIRRRDEAVEQILGTVTADTPAETVRQLNRWLTEHNEYNTTPDLTTIGNEPHECLSALEGREGRQGPVCDGYARAFKVLCDRLEIACVLENGYAKTSPDSEGTFHMWNAVEIGGQWYGVDVTWNDPMVKGGRGAKSGRENEQFLLVGADTVVRKMAFAASHPATNKASVDGVAFDNGPSLSSVAFSAVTANAGLSALPFDDVPESAWFYDSVAYVYERNLMTGTSAGRFTPDGTTTRQQLWMILARAAGEQPADMAAARVWAMASGVSDGGDPGGVLNREQLVTMLWRYAGEPACDEGLEAFRDGGTVSSYAVEPMGWAVSNGIIAGMEDGTIRPGGSAVRAQVAAIFQRLLAAGRSA